MATRYGIQFSGTDPNKRADGRAHNADMTSYGNIFNLATEGGDTGPYLLARPLAPGCVPDSIKLASGANLSAINFTVGTIATPAKYMTAFAGPNANTVSAEAVLALTFVGTGEVAEDIYLFPSAAMPGAGTLRAKLAVTKR